MTKAKIDAGNGYTIEVYLSERGEHDPAEYWGEAYRDEIAAVVWSAGGYAEPETGGISTEALECEGSDEDFASRTLEALKSEGVREAAAICADGGSGIERVLGIIYWRTDAPAGEGTAATSEGRQELLQGMVDEYAAWSRGDCYGFGITGPGGEEVEEVVWGCIDGEFYPMGGTENNGWMIEDAMSTIRVHREDADKDREDKWATIGAIYEVA